MNTIHSYTNDQPILDVAHKDPRRARAPARTSSRRPPARPRPWPWSSPISRAGSTASPAGPTPTVSVVDFTASITRPTRSRAQRGLPEAAAGPLKGILGVLRRAARVDRLQGRQPDPRSSTPHRRWSIGGNLVKVIAWYDNEWGYSCRVADLIRYRRRAPARRGLTFRRGRDRRPLASVALGTSTRPVPICRRQPDEDRQLRSSCRAMPLRVHFAMRPVLRGTARAHHRRPHAGRSTRRMQVRRRVSPSTASMIASRSIDCGGRPSWCPPWRPTIERPRPARQVAHDRGRERAGIVLRNVPVVSGRPGSGPTQNLNTNSEAAPGDRGAHQPLHS